MEGGNLYDYYPVFEVQEFQALKDALPDVWVELQLTLRWIWNSLEPFARTEVLWREVF